MKKPSRQVLSVWESSGAGGADSALLSWGRVFGPLADRVHVYAPDWPGYGGSEPIDGVLTNEQLVRTLEAILDQIGEEKPHLVGISMGGETAIGYALAHPDRVKTLTLVGSGAMQERAPFHALAWPVLHLPLVAKPLARWQWISFAHSPRLLERSLRPLLPSWQAIPAELVRMIQDELNGRSKPEAFFEWQADEVRFGRLKTNFTARRARAHDTGQDPSRRQGHCRPGEVRQTRSQSDPGIGLP